MTTFLRYRHFLKLVTSIIFILSISFHHAASQNYMKSELIIGETTNPGKKIYYEDVLFADYDNDGDLDIFLLRGDDSKLLRNDGADSFSDVDIPIPDVIEAAADWGDYDRDGDLDLAITGYDQQTNRIYIIENLGDDQFESRLIEIYGVRKGLNYNIHSCGIKWFDYNNDAVLDLFLCGDDRFGNPKTILIEQSKDGYLTESDLELTDISGVPEICDIDRDGDLDIMVKGVNTMHQDIYIFRNESGEGFSEYKLEGASGRSVWGDYLLALGF